VAHTYPRPPFRFGGRVTDGYRTGHRARDVAPRNDDDGWVYAVESGTVTAAVTGNNPGDEDPNLIAVKTADGSVTIYAHVDPCPDIFRVIVGWPVRRGQRIGRVDESGQSSGRHVHLVRLPHGSGTLDDILGRVDTQAVFFNISLQPWPPAELP
jgi:murein DD-endopeptidase MepM/ murein hydrolase activator NlpD